MSDIRKVLKHWPLKDGFRSISQKIYRATILRWVDQKFELLAVISFESYLQNIALSSLQLFSCASYQVDLDDRSRQKKHKFFIFLKDRYFVMDGPIDMNVGVFERLLRAF